MKKLMTLSLIVASFGLAGCKSLQDYMQDVKDTDAKAVSQTKVDAPKAVDKAKATPASHVSHRKLKKVSDEKTADEKTADTDMDAPKVKAKKTSYKGAKSLKKVSDEAECSEDMPKAKDKKAENMGEEAVAVKTSAEEMVAPKEDMSDKKEVASVEPKDVAEEETTEAKDIDATVAAKKEDKSAEADEKEEGYSFY